MNLPAIPAASVDRLSKFCGLLGSDAVGERASAASMATKLLRGAGWTWADLVAAAMRPAPRPEASRRNDHTGGTGWRADVAMCRRFPDWLTDWEAGFLNSIARRRSLTPKQRNRLAEIVAKVKEGGND